MQLSIHRNVMAYDAMCVHGESIHSLALTQDDCVCIIRKGNSQGPKCVTLTEELLHDPLVASFVLIQDNPVDTAVVPFTPQHTVSHTVAFRHYYSYYLPVARGHLWGAWETVKTVSRELWSLFRFE